MYERLIKSELVEQAAAGVPNRILAGIQADNPHGGADSYYLVRVRSQDDPTVTVFVFDGESEKEVSSRIDKANRRHH